MHHHNDLASKVESQPCIFVHYRTTGMLTIERNFLEHSFRLDIFRSMSRKKKTMAEVNLIELVPERTIEYETREDSLVTILKPRFTSKLARRFIEPRARVKTFKIDLDEIGSAVWNLCDGKRTVGEIGEEMKARFGDRIEPCYDRLALFFANLEASGFIKYLNIDALRKG